MILMCSVLYNPSNELANKTSKTNNQLDYQLSTWCPGVTLIVEPLQRPRKFNINIVYVAVFAKKTFFFNLACGKPSHQPGVSNEAWPCRTCFGSA